MIKKNMKLFLFLTLEVPSVENFDLFKKKLLFTRQKFYICYAVKKHEEAILSLHCISLQSLHICYLPTKAEQLWLTGAL
jgi:hypothetical protein